MGLMGRRRRRPLARMAVGAATAGVAYHAGKKRSEQDQYNEQASAAYDATTQAPPAEYVPPAPAPSGGSDVDQLSKLADLHASGALSDEEFSAAKSKLLGI